jgi:3-oxoacyl-[acyl-carrier protein] reductase
LEELRQETPLEKLGKPEDVAETIFYLASPQASFVTGTVLDVSGGFVM